MKINTKIVIDMKTGKLVSEESYDYKGPVAQCSGSSGGSSGTVDFPDYMKTIHEAWLTGTAGTDTITGSINDAIDGAYDNSPWAAAVAYAPASDIAAYETEISDFAFILGGLDDTIDWNSFHVQAASSMSSPTTVPPLTPPTDVSAIADTTDVSEITDVAIDADSDALSDLLDDEISAKILPRFRGGMRDARASLNAAFPIGEAIIEAFKTRDVAKHNSTLRAQAALKNPDINLENEKLHLDVRKTNATIESQNEELALRAEEGTAKVRVANKQNEMELVKVHSASIGQMVELMKNRIGWEQAYLQYFIEGKRIKIVANKEQVDMDNKIDEKDVLWNLGVWKAGVNVMASISGAAVSQGEETSTLQSALGGALSGAAMGAQLTGGNPIGAAAGGVLGAAMSLM